MLKVIILSKYVAIKSGNPKINTSINYFKFQPPEFIGEYRHVIYILCAAYTNLKHKNSKQET